MSEIKVNKLSSRTGNAVTLGTSGDTFTIPAGVTLTNSGTATGFGSDSDISWQAVQTADFTAVAGKGYFVDSSGGAKTVTLPASPSIGDTVAVHALDGASNAVTIARNSSNIQGGTDNLTLGSNYAAVTLVYSDAANGWVKHNDEVPPSFVSATGGTETTSGDFKIHTFNSSSNFVISNISDSPANNEVSYLVVAGGAGGGGDRGGGGGAGGFRESKSGADSYSSSPLEGTTNISVTAQTYPITVGAGGAGGNSSSVGSSGANSTFSTITSAGGGGGGNSPPGGAAVAVSGGSGGGARSGYSSSLSPTCSVGSGNTPPVSPPQGNNGGRGYDGVAANTQSGGGGGAGAVGGNGSSNQGGAGGNGVATSITGSSVSRAAGGGGGTDGGASNFQAGGGAGGAGGTGGGGAGNNNGPTATPSGGAGTSNTGSGGGGGGASTGANGGAGGSGVVILRYKYQ